MIKKFYSKNFRNVNIPNLTFDRINLLIGGNNSGKTNFIRALTFLSDMLRNSRIVDGNTAFLDAVQRHGWDHMRKKDVNRGDPIELSWLFELDGESFEYRFSFQVGDKPDDCNITLERLNSAEKSDYYSNPFNFFSCHDAKSGQGVVSSAMERGQTNKRMSFSVNPQETIIAQIKDILLDSEEFYQKDRTSLGISKKLNKIKSYFEHIGVYSTSRFSSEKISLPAPVRSTDSLLCTDASNFVSVFNTYNVEKGIHWKKIFQKKAKELIHDLESIEIVNAYEKMIFRLGNNGGEFDLEDISEGTIKALVLNLLINMPKRDDYSLLAIDEPEMNLHPAWQKVVANWMQETDTFQQIFISTHSPDFLDGFTEGFKAGDVSVFVFSERSPTKKILYEDIKEDLGDWELGDLYRTNDPALGGWPW